MNQLDLTQTGGFPLDQDVLSFQQENIFMLQQLAAFCGPRAILSGCVELGSNVSNGYVVIDGEVLPLVGGIKQAKLTIKTVVTNMLYEDGFQKPSQQERYIEFGDDGVTTILWADFKRNTTEGVLARLNRLEWLVAPDLVDGGSMRLWRKTADIPLPAGWREVVDWQDRVLRGRKPGVANFEVGDEGGADTHTLTKQELPSDPIPYTKTKLGIDFGSGSTRDSWTDVETGNLVLGESKPFSTLPKYKIIMFIEPIPGYIA